MSTISKRQHAVKSRESSGTAAADVLTSLVVPVIQLKAHFSRAGEKIARTGGQSLARWLVMEAVASGPRTVPQVARALGLSRQSVQRLADLLEEDGLAVYEENPQHQRSKLVRLTGRGGRTLSAIQAAQRQWANAVGGEIGESDLRHAAHVVDRLTRALKE